MTEDIHLGTGEYNPEKYWSSRAIHSKDKCLDAICVFGATKDENETAHRVQLSALNKALKGIDLYGANVLEYGCGIGRWISFFRQRGCIWHGVDISDEMLSIAKKTNENVALDKTVENQIPYPNNFMDFVYSITVVHHNPYELQGKIISEMCRVLKKGGYLLLLEDIGETGQFNMFPRTLISWIGFIEEHGLSCCWYSTLGYWFLHRLIIGFFRWLYLIIKKSEDQQKINDAAKIYISSFFKKLIDKADLTIDPYIWQHAPRRFKNSAIMLFKK